MCYEKENSPISIQKTLDQAYNQNNTPVFIEKDPISIPHRFSLKEDIEISAFLTSILAFGKRSIIINKANDLMRRMGNTPYEFIQNGNPDSIKGFKHRTINDVDMIYYIRALKEVYESGSFGSLFSNDIESSLIEFRKIFFSLPHEKRSERHISDVAKNSTAKRLNMFLRWMVRKDNIDFGLWCHIDKSNLYIPLDVHVESISRKIGLLQRKTSDWKAVKELTVNLREFDPSDPIKYDIALFSLDLT